MLVWLYPVLS